MNTRDKLTALRTRMQTHNLDAFIIPSTDPHQSEYVADCWKARAWLSGFTGSAGTVVITKKDAGLWTDSRYYIQAARELEGSGIRLFKTGMPEVPSCIDWLGQELEDGATVGVDGAVVSVENAEEWTECLEEYGMTLNDQNDLIGEIWTDRPDIPKNPVFLVDDNLTGETRRSKFQRIRNAIHKHQAQAHLITALDDIAWTFNFRGADVEYNPVAISYAVVAEQEIRLFIDSEKLTPEVKQALEADDVLFMEYEDIVPYLQNLSGGTTILFDPAKTSRQLYNVISSECVMKEDESVPYLLKAVKNATEIEGVRQAHIRDGAAVVKWMYWLEQQMEQQVEHTEITLLDKLTALRRQNERFHGLSFGGNVSYQANAAMCHYQPKAESACTVKPAGILLTDTGGQYLDGTTDITRTITLARPTPEQKTAFTLVLRGHIRVAMAKFPKGTRGSQIDTLAREALWQHGFDYGHGTGHGVGHFLNVHENPPRIRVQESPALKPGFLISNEPGVYFEGRYGIRIENLVIVVPAETTEFGKFYQFETVTMCPIDLELVEVAMLTAEEKVWLNTYHKTVYETLAPRLSQEEQAWLQHKTREI